ncbi:DUF2817-containing protein [Fragilaria crotonensis]|nr:DUF2817-containing protein [Fragilaria crotonensis]
MSLLFRGAIVAIAVAAGWKYFFHSDDSPCTSDVTVLTVFGTVDPCTCFSETYIDARSKFRKAAADAGAELFTLDIYQNYTTDIAYIPGETNSDVRDLVVHTSGVHGSEGYAGSAIQIAFLKNLPPRNDDGMPKRPSILLVHAVNPYGMAHYRRVNENNVDLNRNGIHDFSQVIDRDPNITGYVDFDHVFNPVKPFRFGYMTVFIQNILEQGVLKLKKAMVTGQYHKANGISYGGTHLEASNQKLYDFCKNFLTTHAPVGKTTWVDVHTGLGTYGTDTILVPLSEPSTLRHAVAETFNESLVPGATGGDEVHQGYDLMTGSTDMLMRPLFSSPHDWHVTQDSEPMPSSRWDGRSS